MSEQPLPNAPFKTLGTHLKYLREHSRESLAEVSGAVEIDEMHLQRIEQGVERPPEDILLLLINHFNMRDQEAVQLWELAGYDGELPDKVRHGDTAATENKPVIMLLAVDMRTAYSDRVDILANQAGVTLNFAQTAGQGRFAPVARVGMSYEQAEQVLQALQQAMLRAKYLQGPKLLPPSISTDPDTSSFA